MNISSPGDPPSSPPPPNTSPTVNINFVHGQKRPFEMSAHLTTEQMDSSNPLVTETDQTSTTHIAPKRARGQPNPNTQAQASEPFQFHEGQLPQEVIDEENLLRDALKTALRAATRLTDPTNSFRWNWDHETADLVKSLYMKAFGTPRNPSNAQNAILNAISDLGRSVSYLSTASRLQQEKLDKIESSLGPNQPTTRNRPQNLGASIHAPTFAQAAASGPRTQPTPPAKPVSNPSKAHHPSRLVISFLNKVKPEDRRRETDIVRDINAYLADKPEAAHLKVTAIRWNSQGNAIVFTRADQTAAELQNYADKLPEIIAPGHQGTTYEDKKWFKVEISGVWTGAFESHFEGVFSPETIHNHLAEANPGYARLNVVQLPRWIRPEQELTNKAYSSVVFAVDSSEQQRQITKEIKTLAAFGRIVKTREWSDRPPIKQCKKCWQFDHHTQFCKAKDPKCRLCGDNHMEADHPTPEANEILTDEANTQAPTTSCINCKKAGLADTSHTANWTRCPERLRNIGNLREREKEGSTNPTRPQRRTTKPRPRPSQPSPNPQTLTTPSPSVVTIIQQGQSRGLRNTDPETVMRTRDEITTMLTL